MKWYKPLFFGESLSEDWKRRKVLFKLVNRISQKDIYVISMYENDKNLFRIFAADFLLKKSYLRKNIKIVGVATGKEEAFKLLETIINQIYLVDGHLNNIRDYFVPRRLRR